jgi:para-nitrobenzyl esterase
VAARVVAQAAKVLGVSADAKGFQNTTAEQCVDALKQISNPKTRINLRDSSGRDPLFGISKMAPIFGDDVLPEHPLAAIAKGMSADVEVIAGANSDEMNLYFVPTGVRQKIRGPLAIFALKRSLPKPIAVLRDYGLWQKGISAGAAFSSALTDLVFRAPVRQLAAAHKGKSYVYNFDWHSPACNGELGACHGLELPFVFNNLACCIGANGLCGQNPPADMAEQIHKLWVNMIHGEEVPWPRFNAASRTVFDLESGDLEPEQPLQAEKYLPAIP